jgi:hypothetical protein
MSPNLTPINQLLTASTAPLVATVARIPTPIQKVNQVLTASTAPPVATATSSAMVARMLTLQLLRQWLLGC